MHFNPTTSNAKPHMVYFQLCGGKKKALDCVESEGIWHTAAAFLVCENWDVGLSGIQLACFPAEEQPDCSQSGHSIVLRCLCLLVPMGTIYTQEILGQNFNMLGAIKQMPCMN